jgi:serine/threonine protein phosphatase PrpC
MLNPKYCAGMHCFFGAGAVLDDSFGYSYMRVLYSRKLLSTDRFLVIASDGVFEFLTNQMVAELIAQQSDDPQQSCKIISQQAYNLWLQYEVRTDDITIIIIKLQGNFHRSVATACLRSNAIFTRKL